MLIDDVSGLVATSVMAAAVGVGGFEVVTIVDGGDAVVDAFDVAVEVKAIGDCGIWFIPPTF